MSEIHPNYIKAQRLMIFLIIAGFVYFFLSDAYNNTSSRNKIMIPVAIILVGGLNTYLLGKGYWWMKYALLVLFLAGFVKPSAWTYLSNIDVVGFIAVAFRMGINLWIIWLLFKVPNKLSVNKKGPDLPEPL